MSQQGLTSRVAWRVSFIVPTILLLTMAALVFFTSEDTPTGKWSERAQISAHAPIVTAEGETIATDTDKKSAMTSSVKQASDDDLEKTENSTPARPAYEVVKAPSSLLDILRVVVTPQTAMLAIPYACSFGGELALNSILSAWVRCRSLLSSIYF